MYTKSIHPTSCPRHTHDLNRRKHRRGVRYCENRLLINQNRLCIVLNRLCRNPNILCRIIDKFYSGILIADQCNARIRVEPLLLEHFFVKEQSHYAYQNELCNASRTALALLLRLCANARSRVWFTVTQAIFEQQSALHSVFEVSRMCLSFPQVLLYDCLSVL